MGKLFSIQVTDARGQWVTLKSISLETESEIRAEIDQIRQKRGNRSVRAVCGFTNIIYEDLVPLGGQKG